METANLTFRMTHPAPSDLDSATALARAILDQVSAAAPMASHSGAEASRSHSCPRALLYTA